MARQSRSTQFIEVFDFQQDKSKPGRTLSTAKIGDIFMSQLVVKPKVTTGNYYHKKTRIMFFVTKGQLECTFVHVKTKERKVLTLKPGSKVIHVPPFISFSTKNITTTPAVIIYFSTMPLRSHDSFPFPVT